MLNPPGLSGEPYNYADWGEFYKIVSCNEYGSSSGDTIFTNSLIKNPEILNYLETIRNQTSAIDVVPNTNGQISIQNNKITKVSHPKLME